MESSKSNNKSYFPHNKSLKSELPTHPPGVGLSHEEDTTVGTRLMTHRQQSFQSFTIGLLKLCLFIIFPLTFSMLIHHFWSIR